MATSDQIDDLMLRWETARQSGRSLPVEVLCASCPELTEAVRRQIRAVLGMEEILGVTQHALNPDRTASPENGTPASQIEDFPQIPGYEIVRIIDQGGMGIIFEARQVRLNRTVAIKMISTMALRPKAIARFQSEAEAAARLQHPNFVQVFEVGQINGRPFFSMEYVPGGSLADEIARQPPTARRAAELVETLARAVHAAHEASIVHRDLKPSNIMLAADGTPKIADFGLAKRLDDDSGHTHTGEILGTPSYMAPEQAEGKKDEIGPHTDVHALGAVLYELLAGKPPFQGASPLEALRQVVGHEPTAPSKLVASVPRDLDAICLKCLEKSPSQRYTSAVALAEDLHRFLAGQPVTARRVGPLARTWKWCRRHPQAVALIALALLLAMVPVPTLINQYRAHRQIVLKAQEQAPLVREILQRNCYECHGQNPKKIERNLNILDHKQLVNNSRRIVVPGAPEDSRLMKRIADGSMPPEDEEVRLPRVSEQEVAILRDWILGGAPPLPEADAAHRVPSAVPFSESAAEVKSIFHERCYECHSHDKAKGGIKILHHRLLVTVHRVVVPFRPEESELFELIRLKVDDKRCMPPKGEDRLDPEEIESIRRWIAEGAPPFPKETK